MKTKLSLIVFVIIVLTGGFSIRATREAERTQAAIRELAAQRAGLRQTIATVEQQLRAANVALAKLEQETGRHQSELDPAVDANAREPGKETTAQPASPARRLPAGAMIANDPKKLAEYAQNFRASLDHTYGGMFKALNLSPERIERLKDLKVWLEEQRMDLNAAVAMHRLDSNYAWAMATARAVNDLTVLTLDSSMASDPSGALSKQWHQSRMAKEAELLGDLLAPYREYYRTKPVRYLVGELAGTSVYSGEPVTSAQAERTAQILAANSQRGQTGAARGWVMPNTVNWDAASAQLQGVLSPSQVATLETLVQRDVKQATLNQQIARLTAQFKGLPPPK